MGKVMFSQASVCQNLWGYPIPGQDGGTSQVRMGAVPHPRSECLVPLARLGLGGYRIPGQNGGYPLFRSGWGVPLASSGWGVPSSQVKMGGNPFPGQDGGGGTPSQVRIGYPQESVGQEISEVSFVS